MVFAVARIGLWTKYPCEGSAAHPTGSLVPIFGVLRNRVVPPGRPAATLLPERKVRAKPWLRVLVQGNLFIEPVPTNRFQRASVTIKPYRTRPQTQGLGGCEAEKRARSSGRGRGGDKVHPSASQSNHFPNLLFCYAVAPADWPGNARLDPGETLWGQK